MKEKLKNEKGITLIALVVTIIILIILAGVAISVSIGDNGLFQKSREAVNKYKTAEEDESKILDDVSTQIENYSEQVDNTQGEANTKKGGNNYAYNNPVIPVGFKTSLEGASWKSTEGKIVDGWNEGLVIEDKEGNQFVWVPVDNIDVRYEKDFRRDSANYNETNVIDERLPEGISSELDQINTYHGFYIARYEAGIPETMENTINERNKEGVPVSKKNQIPWTLISKSNALNNSEKMYHNDYVQSGLITETQWDTVMKWIENSGIDVLTNSGAWGNYTHSAVTGITEYSTDYGITWTKVPKTTKGTSVNEQWLLKTGHSDYTKVKNIYDLAGNVFEMENACRDRTVLIFYVSWRTI